MKTLDQLNSWAERAMWEHRLYREEHGEAPATHGVLLHWVNKHWKAFLADCGHGTRFTRLTSPPMEAKFRVWMENRVIIGQMMHEKDKFAKI